MSGSVVLIAWLVAVWVALWEALSWANVLGGVAVAAGLVIVFPRRVPAHRGRVRPLAAAHFMVFFLWKLIEASAVVAWEVVTPRNRINEGIVAVPVRGVSDALLTVVANAISLTPGTLTIEVDEDPAVLYVHVLHLQDIEAVRRDVQRLERLAIGAFGGNEARQALGAGRDGTGDAGSGGGRSAEVTGPRGAP